MQRPSYERPGAQLTSPVGLAAAALIVGNDLWLKRTHPGWLSGKLSDVGLVVVLPLFVAAIFEWVLWSTARSGWLPSKRQEQCVRPIACAAAAVYFIAVKTWPSATHAHEAWLAFVVPFWRFRAVTDPTDLLCLPAMLLAWRALKSASGQRSAGSVLAPPTTPSGSRVTPAPGSDRSRSRALV